MPPRAEEVMLKLNYFIVSVLLVWLWVVEGVLANDWCPIQGGGEGGSNACTKYSHSCSILQKPDVSASPD